MKQLTIVHLYPVEMNIYGDTGNVLTLRKRAEWRGIKTEVVLVGPGEAFPKETNLIVSGGGQDSGQLKVEADLQAKAKQLKAMANDGVVMLTVCGTYQLFGHEFLTNQGDRLRGIGIFDARTVAGAERLIGNVIVSTKWGELVGYENHSGLTELQDGQASLGQVISGAGNNGRDGHEGAVTNNVFGTYLHGSLLPKNPQFADELLRRALAHAGLPTELQPLDDSLAEAAARVAKSRPR